MSVQAMKTQDFGFGGQGGNSQWNEQPDVKEKRAKTGLRVLLAVISSLFFLFIIAFMIRSQLSDWEHLSAPWKPLENPWQLWINTFFLGLASVCLQYSKISAANNNIQRAVQALSLAGLFSLAFIAGQLLMWKTLSDLGYYLAGNPANSFFYLFTGLHALHLLGGLVAWVKTMRKALSGVAIDRLRVSIDLCTTYWHYLLALWLVLLGLLTSSPETYDFLARLCGLK